MELIKYFRYMPHITHGGQEHRTTFFTTHKHFKSYAFRKTALNSLHIEKTEANKRKSIKEN